MGCSQSSAKSGNSYTVEASVAKQSEQDLDAKIDNSCASEDTSDLDTDCASVVADLPSDVTTVYYSNPLMRARKVDAQNVRPYDDSEVMDLDVDIDRLQQLFRELLIFQESLRHKSEETFICVTEDGWADNTPRAALIRIREVLAEIRRGECWVDQRDVEAAYRKIFQEQMGVSDLSSSVLYGRFQEYQSTLTMQLEKLLGNNREARGGLVECRAATLPISTFMQGPNWTEYQHRSPAFAIHYDSVTPARPALPSVFFSTCYVAQPPCCTTDLSVSTEVSPL